MVTVETVSRLCIFLNLLLSQKLKRLIATLKTIPDKIDHKIGIDSFKNPNREIMARCMGVAGSALCYNQLNVIAETFYTPNGKLMLFAGFPSWFALVAYALTTVLICLDLYGGVRCLYRLKLLAEKALRQREDEVNEIPP